MAKLSKRDLVDAVALETGISKKDTEAVVDTLFSVMEKTLVKGDEVSIINFGTFMQRKRGERIGTHPFSHEKITIKESRSIAFKLSNSLKDKLD